MPSAASLSRATTKRGLILHDSLIFLALCGVSVALFLVTLGLFRSFEHHREELGRTWAARGQEALAQGQPQAAVNALRTALTYRDDLPVQLQLAQALADAGRTEEALNYFLTLRESRPGDGLINLQLARLSRKQGDAQEAIDYYRASIFGNWEGDGAQRRREARLELAGYLAERGNTTAARDEILIAAGNTPETPNNAILFASRLQAVGALPEALSFYQKALARDPHNYEAQAAAGRLAYSLGQYTDADTLLSAAVAERHKTAAEKQQSKSLQELASNARRIPALTLSRDLPAAERADHLLLAATIAHTRLQGCLAAPTTPAAVPATAMPPDPTLAALHGRWEAAASQLKKRVLERDAALEDTVAQLINDTEQQTVAPCGAPQGDDALLLLLSQQRPQVH